jgi:hypothetical protein
MPQHAHSDCDACGWSVKDVPERFVKDVMELDILKGRSSTAIYAAILNDHSSMAFEQPVLPRSRRFL